jgi:hypothetical protein
MAGPWRVRFVHKSVLLPFVQDEEWPMESSVLRRATDHLGYVPWIFWVFGDNPDGPPGGVRCVCPWCFAFGSVGLRPHKSGGAVWQWNGQAEGPTLTPSVRNIITPGSKRQCSMHVFVTNGQIVDAGTPPH